MEGAELEISRVIGGRARNCVGGDQGPVLCLLCGECEYAFEFCLFSPPRHVVMVRMLEQKG